MRSSGPAKSPVKAISPGQGNIKLFRSTEQEIHSTAIVHPKAQIGSGVRVGPYCIIGEGVVIGRGTVLENNVSLEGPLTIGEENYMGPFVSVGQAPQHLAYRGEPTRVEIGDRNVFREYVTVHRGTVQGTGVTRIGNDNYLMVFVHVGHDCEIGNNIVIANSCHLGGHVRIEDRANIGGMSGIHQFVRIGGFAMIGGCSTIRHDVPPFCLVEGNPATSHGLNAIGLRRNGFGAEAMSLLKKAYKILFRSGIPVKEAVQKVDEELKKTPEVERLRNFILVSKRGLVR